MLFALTAGNLTIFQAEDLARVRNNQRKCRARQKEYIRDLEQRVQLYKITQHAQLDVLQKKIELLSVENQLLKHFVESVTPIMYLAFASPLPPSREAGAGTTGSEVGFDLLLSSDYATTSKLVPGVSSIIYLLTVIVSILSNNAQATSALQDSKSIDISNDLFEGSMMASNTFLPECLLFDDQAVYMPDLPTSVAEISETLRFPQTELGPHNFLSPKECEKPASGCPAMACNSQTSVSLPTPTVSCSEACELLVGYARRKPDLMSLHLRLQDGYRKSLVPGEGCRLIIICC